MKHPPMSVRAYAKHRSVSHTAVQKALKAGYLSNAIIKTAAGDLIDPGIADKNWYPKRSKEWLKTPICPICGRKYPK